jgi:hypothetical protein
MKDIIIAKPFISCPTNIQQYIKRVRDSLRWITPVSRVLRERNFIYYNRLRTRELSGITTYKVTVMTR